MPAPLLETKLYLPRRRDGLVPRSRLSERLDRGAAARLMLVSAPAGFGKTTLLAEWLARGPAAAADGPSAAWLSLDRGDNDPASFWTYVIAALRTVAPGVGASELALLSEPKPPPIQLVLTTLLNDLGADGSDIVLVLDDYHLIDSREVQEAMAFPARSRAATAAPGDRQPRRSGPAARSASRARRARRDPSRRAAVHRRRGGGLPQRSDGPAADGGGRGSPGGTHRGVDSGAAAGRALDAGTRRRRRLHLRLRGR